MAELIQSERKSRVLAPSSLSCLSSLPTINLTAGCAHGCVYCYTRGYSSYPGESRVNLYHNTLELLQKELPRKKVRPHAVYFSPSSDIFQPITEVLDQSYRVLEYLLDQGVGVAFLTKGEIPEKHLELLKTHREMVRAQVGLISPDHDLIKILEPRAASPQTRLSQIKELIDGGIEAQLRIDPIIPGVTDGMDALHGLFEGAAESGVKRAAAGILFIRPAITWSLKRNIQNSRLREIVFSHFAKAEPISMRGEDSKVLALPKEERQAILRQVGDIGREHGIQVKLCACKNPDFASGTCSIAGDWSKVSDQVEQLPLFDEKERI